MAVHMRTSLEPCAVLNARHRVIVTIHPHVLDGRFTTVAMIVAVCALMNCRLLPREAITVVAHAADPLQPLGLGDGLRSASATA
jgi:hypothetical protein